MTRESSEREGFFLDLLVRRLPAMPAWTCLSLPAAVLVAVAFGNSLTGNSLDLAAFYLVAVGLATLGVSRRAGHLYGILAAVLWASEGPPGLLADILNFLLLWGFFAFMTEMLYRTTRDHRRVLRGSRTDGLTGIPNARAFTEALDSVLARQRRDGLPFTLAYADLDKFKAVNDGYGHGEGDRVLRDMASLFSGVARKTDTLARLGGDEFALLLPATDAEGAIPLLARLQAEVASRSSELRGAGVTIGAMTFTSPPANVDTAIRLTDDLMYRGKAAGRGRTLRGTWPGGGADEEAFTKVPCPLCQTDGSDPSCSYDLHETQTPPE